MAEDCIPITEASQRKYTARLAYAALSLAVTTALFMFFLPLFASHLVHADRVNLLRDLDEYSPLTWATFCLVEFVAALLFSRSLKRTLPQAQPVAQGDRKLLPAIGLGLMTGLIALAVAVPVLLWGHGRSALATFFLDHLYGLPGLALLVVLLIFLPVAAEILFRGVFLACLLEITTIGPALILSSLLFAWTWQVLNPAAAFVFSVGSGFLFYRTRSILSCAVANFVFTLGGTSLMVLRALRP
jgi:membrane protease YdiL (CAAX protease family)